MNYHPIIYTTLLHCGGGGNQTADESTDKLRECYSDKIADFSSGIYCRAQNCQQGDFEGVTQITVSH